MYPVYTVYVYVYIYMLYTRTLTLAYQVRVPGTVATARVRSTGGYFEILVQYRL